MPSPYPVLTANDTVSAYKLFQYSSNVSGGLFMPIMMVVIWVIAFMGAMAEGRQMSRAFIFASFIYAILSMMLAFVNLISANFMYFSFLLVAIGLLWYKLDNAPGL